MNTAIGWLAEWALHWRILFIVGIAAAAHLIVLLIRQIGTQLSASQNRTANKKLRSVASLVTSVLVFSLYFFTIGLIFKQFGVSLTAYLASASIIGLAVGFGSQGIVQDVVTGLTIIFSDLLDVGELVEISGQTGVVRGIGMRFVELENALGAYVFVPNRTINNVINYPRGYVRCIADVALAGDGSEMDKMAAVAERLMQGVYDQFPGVLRTPPSVEGRYRTSAGKEYLRLKFRVWPGRGQPIEDTFRKELARELRRFEPDYQDWMIAVNYEVEQRVPRKASGWSWTRRKKTTAAAGKQP